jgi:hypothetical protein
MQLAQLGSDRYMRGGEMIGRLGGQDTLAARQAQQGALERQSGMDLEAQIEQQRATEREADISGFLRGARSLAGREQDIGAQMDRADRQLEQARVLAPQYQSAADLQRSDAMMQQDLADRALARGMTITEPTTRERFEEGVRGAQEAEALARAGVSGYLDGESTLARETKLDLERERIDQDAKNLSNELANRVRLGTLDAEKAIAVQQAINTGNIDLARAQLEGEAGMQTERVEAEKEMQTERVQAESRDLQNQLANNVRLGILDAEKEANIQSLINSGQLDLAKEEIASAERMQTERVDAQSKDLMNQLANNVQMGILDAEKAIEIQGLINTGNLDLATKELEGITKTLDFGRKAPN